MKHHCTIEICKPPLLQRARGSNLVWCHPGRSRYIPHHYQPGPTHQGTPCLADSLPVATTALNQTKILGSGWSQMYWLRWLPHWSEEGVTLPYRQWIKTIVVNLLLANIHYTNLVCIVWRNVIQQFHCSCCGLNGGRNNTNSHYSVC